MFDFLCFLYYNVGMKKVEQKLELVYNFTVNYIEENGFPPSVREICAKCDIKSTATAYSYVEKLKERGLLNKSPLKKRAITLTTSKNEYKSIPVVGTVAAGAPIFAVENLDGYMPLPPDFDANGDYFALKIQGESMINAGICDKDIIIVCKQATAENGDIIVALVDDSATVKRFYKKDGKIILHPENDFMEDMIFDSVSILGKVKGLMRRF